MHVITIQTLDKLRSLADPSYLEFLKKIVPSKKEVLGIKDPSHKIKTLHRENTYYYSCKCLIVYI